jgi:hypothetical protein
MRRFRRERRSVLKGLHAGLASFTQPAATVLRCIGARLVASASADVVGAVRCVLRSLNTSGSWQRRYRGSSGSRLAFAGLAAQRSVGATQMRARGNYT